MYILWPAVIYASDSFELMVFIPVYSYTTGGVYTSVQRPNSWT